MNQNQNYTTTNLVSSPDLSLCQETPGSNPRLAEISFQQSFRGRGFGRGLSRGRAGGRVPVNRGRGVASRSTRFSDCEYCYVQARVHGKNVDYRHNVKACPLLRLMFQPSVNALVNDDDEEQDHPFDVAFHEYSEQFPNTFFGEELNEGSQ